MGLASRTHARALDEATDQGAACHESGRTVCAAGTRAHRLRRSKLPSTAILGPLYNSTRNPAHPPRGRARLYYSTRTRRVLRHPSIPRQTYHRDKVGPPNPQANQESCVSFPFRTEITRPELPDPPPSRPRHLALKSPSATRPERGQLSQVLDGTVNTVERRRIPRIRPWTPPLSPRFSYMTSAPARREGLLAAIAHLLPHLKLAAVHDVATSGGLPRSFSRRPPRTAAA